MGTDESTGHDAPYGGGGAPLELGAFTTGTLGAAPFADGETLTFGSGGHVVSDDLSVDEAGAVISAAGGLFLVTVYASGTSDQPVTVETNTDFSMTGASLTLLEGGSGMAYLNAVTPGGVVVDLGGNYPGDVPTSTAVNVGVDVVRLGDVPLTTTVPGA